MARTDTTYFNRADTMFGVCQAIGDTFGFNANILRLLLGVSVLVVPWAALTAYVGMGVVIFAAHKLLPNRTSAKLETVAQDHGADNDADAIELAQAA